MKFKFLFLSVITIFIYACIGTTFIPKPRGLNHIELPEVAYKTLEVDSIPYTFSYNVNAEVLPHHGIRTEQIIHYKKLNAKIWLTYKSIKNSQDTLDGILMTSYKLLQKNNVKAESITPDTIRTKSGNIAHAFILSGDVPTQIQFVMHDTTTNFIRGALYFETATKNDSLAPIINYVRKDIEEFVNTIQWKQQ